MYPTVLRVAKVLRASETRAAMGFSEATNIGLYGFPAVQAAPAFATVFAKLFGPCLEKRFPGQSLAEMRCLIPCGIDQDPYFRLCRDAARRLGLPKPALLQGRFLPSLLGVDGKMSASAPTSAIFLNDTRREIKAKVGRCVSGGRKTGDDQREKGADLTVDIPFQYLCFLLGVTPAGTDAAAGAAADQELARYWCDYGSPDTRGAQPELPGVPPFPDAAPDATPAPTPPDATPAPTPPDADKTDYLMTSVVKKAVVKCVSALLRELKAAREQLSAEQLTAIAAVRPLVWTSVCPAPAPDCATGPPAQPDCRPPLGGGACIRVFVRRVWLWATSPSARGTRLDARSPRWCELWLAALGNWLGAPHRPPSSFVVGSIALGYVHQRDLRWICRGSERACSHGPVAAHSCRWNEPATPAL